MKRKEQIAESVRHCYWELDVNCARTALHTLMHLAGLDIQPQVWAAATGMHGAGKFGAQCGLVEGVLLFIGILGADRGLDATAVTTVCRQFAHGFTERFGSLECRVLRPGGFRADDPPHACEGLTREALQFAVTFLAAQPALHFSVPTE